MRCPFCEWPESKVIDSRPTDEGLSIRRRRECLSCEKRFTTYEQVEILPIVVIKKDGKRQAYDKQKLMNGIIRACDKTTVSISKIEEIVSDIELTLYNKMDREVPSSIIGEMTMERLKEIDPVAYVRFASVYREFKDVNTFMNELKKILENN